MGKIQVTASPAGIMLMGMRAECSQSRRRLLAIGLAIALMHQLGACPCGCIEGNLWVQTILRLTGKSLDQPAATSMVAVAPSRVDGQDCEDDHAGLAYVAGHRTTAVDSQAGMGSAVPMHADGALPLPFFAANRFSAERRDRQLSGVSARTLRAQLQVFLI
jgi:hypothetical protein